MVDEAFNLDYRPRRVTEHFPHWFQYICDGIEGPFVERLDKAYGLRYPLRQITELRNRREVRTFQKELVETVASRLHGRRVLAKEPIGVFSIPWLVETYNFHVIVCIRHPAGFVSSLTRLNWQFDFRNWTQQPAFMRDCAGCYAEQIEEFAAHPPPVVDQAVLLWKVIYHRVKEYRDQHPEWRYVRHEDLSRHPFVGFEDLYRDCRLAMSPKVRAFIGETSGTGNPADVPPEEFKTVRRDSAEVPDTWKGRLDSPVIAKIEAETALERSWFYDEA